MDKKRIEELRVVLQHQVLEPCEFWVEADDVADLLALLNEQAEPEKPAPPTADWKNDKCPCREEIPVLVHIDADLSCTEAEKWKTVGIDKCIAPIVRALQAAGINMRGSCCGHGGDGDIALSDGRMLIIKKQHKPVEEEK